MIDFEKASSKFPNAVRCISSLKIGKLYIQHYANCSLEPKELTKIELYNSQNGSYNVSLWFGNEHRFATDTGVIPYSYGFNEHNWLEEVKSKKEKRVFWVNFYSDQDLTCVHKSKEDADKHAAGERICCQRFETEIEIPV